MKTWAILAQFDTPADLMHAASSTRDAGYRKFDCHSPFPIHGMDDAMGLKRSSVGFIVGVMAVIGATIGFVLQTWVATSAYPLVISGKPLFSWQAFIIITFALFVLFGAFGAVFGMFRLIRLPRWHHPLFYSEQFKVVTDDGFVLVIESDDAKFDENGTKEFLAAIGGKNIELVRGEG
ncbi:MAG: DUF3341 domain-containing protein [Ignavibacteria bacterium]|nr:MAG: DUF3341 domain-containing protein [Ignavibacteria bacterium]